MKLFSTPVWVHRKSTAINNQQVMGITNYYCYYSLLIFTLLQTNLCHCTSNNNNNHLRINHQEVPSSDTQDNNDPSTGDPTSGEPDIRDDGFPAPNELSVIRINDTSVVLRWDFPDGSQEQLQFFKIQYKSTRKGAEWKTDNQEILTTTRAYQINGLRPGNFWFSVIAVYDNDDNVPSEQFKYKIRARSKIKPEEMPEMTAPKIYWMEVQSDYFRFKWKYEEKPNDSLYYGFLVYYRSAHIVSDFTIYNTLDTNVEIAELDPDTPFEAKVVAYNTVGVSNFSDTITLRTTKPNTTSTSDNDGPISTSTTTPTPTLVTSSYTTTTSSPPTIKPQPSWPASDIIIAPPSTTLKPSINTVTTPSRDPSHHNSTNDIYQTFITIFEPIFNDQSDAMIIARYLLMILLPLLLVVVLLIFLIRPQKTKKESSPAASTDDSTQFHLEINGYFKNSFPGVEDEYPPMANNNVHNGFVNPHIDDFA